MTLTYFAETLYPASLQTNKKALIPLRIRAFPNFAFLRSGAYGTRTRDPAGRPPNGDQCSNGSAHPPTAPGQTVLTRALS